MNRTLSPMAKNNWFDNGTTALAISLVAAGCRGGYVAVQASVCPSVISAIYASDAQPWFIDIMDETLAPGVATLEPVMDRVCAVLLIHAYGVPGDAERISNLCARYDTPLIEDCAQAEGAQDGSTPVGCHGDYAVFSYGAGKILDLGGGGRVQANRPESSEQLEEVVAHLHSNVDPLAIDRVNVAYKDIYNRNFPDCSAANRIGFTDLLRKSSKWARIDRETLQVLKIEKARAVLAEIIRTRRKKAQCYWQLLEGNPGISFPASGEGSAPWRFNILLAPETRQSVLKDMLARGMRVSSWYPDISMFLEPGVYRAENLDRTRWYGDRLMNLWLDEQTDVEQIDATCVYLNSVVN